MSNNFKAAAHILNCDLLSFKDMDQYINDGWIDTDLLHQNSGAWSSGERAMVRIALDLYDSNSPITDAADLLDVANWQAVAEAVKILRHGA